MPEIYFPEEDSFLLSDVLKKEVPKILKKNPNPKILEIGSGSGFQVETLLSLGVHPKHITLTDINPDAFKFLKEKFKHSKVIHSNLFDKLNKKYDLIFFNPPYLPEDAREPKGSRLATTGGKSGSEVVKEFLKDAKNHLNPDGKIFLLTSSLTSGINWSKYNKKVLAKKKLFFEELVVWELSL
ncbi:putative S-adenosylmethionine-dependent methyltransferase [uncultured archaeon]|nr:putative S-adenosylmethionine-dependent methyltransferase [uncultured archaeon]